MKYTMLQLDNLCLCNGYAPQQSLTVGCKRLCETLIIDILLCKRGDDPINKNTHLVIMVLLLCVLLAACGHQHTWLDATCQTPKICADCGATEGTVQEHNWNDATCQTPKTCMECGTTEGVAAGHTWQAATCQAPKTCAECAVTEGVALAHHWNEATCQTPKTCTECGATEGIALTHTYGEWGAKVQDSFGQWIRSRNCTRCGNQQAEPAKNPTIRTDLGSAGSPDATTLIVSIFANDCNTNWDFEAEEDRATRSLMLSYMESAVSWLTQQIATYGAEPHFIYDWEANPDLYFTYDFDQLLLVRPDAGAYWDQEDYVLESIPSESLKEKYHAQNIIYMFYFNTDERNTVNSWSMGYNQYRETELINIFVRDDYPGGFYYVPASSLAHEIMHCFGAYDLYYASDIISQDYVEHCIATDSMDIMYTVSFGAEIPQLFTQLDAYYMGLIDSCDEVTAWGLGKSAHLE